MNHLTFLNLTFLSLPNQTERVLALPASQEEVITLGECLWFKVR